MIGYLRTLLIGLLIVTVPACGGVQSGVATSATPPGAALEASYLLGAGDKLRIIVFGEEKLTGEYAVSSAGDISFPLIGSVAASGKSVTDVGGAIRTRLAEGYLKDPRVSVEVLNYRPFFILGEVQKPGQYPYATGLTVQQAVATAGGFTYRANTRRVFIKRALSTSEQLVEIRTAPVPVLPGDTVRVGERFF